MSLRRGLLCILSVGVICGAAWAQRVSPPNRGVTTRPAGPGTAKFDDGWLSQIVLDELRQAADEGEYSNLAGRIDAAILARLTCGHLDELKTLNDMVFVRRACKYLPLAGQAGGKGFVNWLLDNRKVSRRLFRALEDVESPDESLRGLHKLFSADEKAVLAYPDLAVAFATSAPMEHYRPQPEPASLLESFQWYTNPKASFRYDLKKMPYEISRYLAATRLSIKERKWAVARYHRTGNPARSYFDLKYDEAHYRGGRPKKIDKHPYTLPNLRRAGGVCIDQAYYAGEVCKALGIPATIVVGRGGGGEHHAWLACLKGQDAVWDSRTGRYKSHLYYLGTVREPAAGRKILDCELALVGAAVRLSLRRREEADAATVAARMAAEAGEKTAQGDLSVLEKLAELYNQRLASKGQGSDKPQAATGWVRAERKIDPDLVEDLIAAAVERNLAHGPAWELIVELRKAGRLPVKNLDRFFDVLVKRTAKHYPDYSCRLFMRIIPTVPDAERRKKVFKNTINIFSGRPDLQGRILIAMGDDYRRQGKSRKAVKAYEQAAGRCANMTEIVLDAAGQAEALFMDAKRRDLAIKMYGGLFSRAKKVRQTAFRHQTAHYQLGKRLAELLMDDGKIKAAEKVLARIK